MGEESERENVKDNVCERMRLVQGMNGKRRDSEGEGERKKKRENHRVEWKTKINRLKLYHILPQIKQFGYFRRHIYVKVCAMRHTITLCHPAEL